jgi:hypothetical protein
MTATQLLVVPKSIPMTLAMSFNPSFFSPQSAPLEAAEMLISFGI